jgi:hypothetical protein
MRRFFPVAAAVVAAWTTIHTVTPAAAASQPSKPEVIVALPGDNEKAEAYWSDERMERATLVRPIVLDPVTKEPVLPG